MSIIQNFLNLLKKLWYAPPTKNIDKQKKNLDSKKNNISFSLKDLEKTGLEIKQVPDSKAVNKEKIIYASQLPAHIFPWVIGMNAGIHLIRFPPEIQSQINSGFLSVTGGVARDQYGPIVSHGANASLLSLSPIMLYQVGVIVFGAYHLKKINKSLEKINKRLDEISSFLIDKRSAEVSGLSLELLHISKGIIEFNKSGNFSEIFNRINLIKHIRIMNSRNLLHLQKELQYKLNNLKNLKRKSWFGSEKEAKTLLSSIADYETILVDYSRSLFLDIICTEVEVAFSMRCSSEEVKSRLSFQRDQTKFLRAKSSVFGKTLNNKFSELIEESWNDDEIIEKRIKNIRLSWKQIRKKSTELDIIYKKHIQSIEDKIKPKDNIIFLKKDDI